MVDLHNSYFDGAGVFVWWFVLKSKKGGMLLVHCDISI